jgi:hypothetical protein
MLDTVVPDFPAGTDVVIRLREGKPEIQCRLSYQERPQRQAIFSSADFSNLKWSAEGNFENIELRRRAGRDIARNAASNRGIVIIAPFLAAAFAFGPTVLWPAPTSDAVLAPLAAANQLAGQLASVRDLSPQLQSEVTSLRAELRTAQATSSAAQAQNADNENADTVYDIVVVLAALAVAVPELSDLALGRRRSAH